MPQQVETKAGTISYTVQGDGEPLILLPGFQSSSASWTNYGYTDHLAEYRLIMIDPLGHGSSHMSHDPADYGIDQTIEQILSVLDAQGIERAAFVGFSRGGMIVASMIDACPDRMTAGIMGGTPLGAARSVTSAALQSGLAALLAGEWAAYWDNYPVPLPPQIKERFELANDPKANGAALQAMQGWPVDAGLSPTTVPRLAYFGSGEVFADGLRAELIANEVDYIERDWAGHAETMGDAAGVSTIITDFLAK